VTKKVAFFLEGSVIQTHYRCYDIRIQSWGVLG